MIGRIFGLLLTAALAALLPEIGSYQALAHDVSAKTSVQPLTQVNSALGSLSNNSIAAAPGDPNLFGPGVRNLATALPNPKIPVLRQAEQSLQGKPAALESVDTGLNGKDLSRITNQKSSRESGEQFPPAKGSIARGNTFSILNHAGRIGANGIGANGGEIFDGDTPRSALTMKAGTSENDPATPQASSLHFLRSLRPVSSIRSDISWDDSGERTRQILLSLDKKPVGTVIHLDFIPSIQSLEKIGQIGRDWSYEFPFEVGLLRYRGTHQWIIVKGAGSGVNIPGDQNAYDIIMHNHPPVRGFDLPYPNEYDLAVTAGLKARLFVISGDSLVEWSSRIPFPGDPDRILSWIDPPEIRNEWVGTMQSFQWWAKNFWALFLHKISSPLRSAQWDLLGVKHERYSLKHLKKQPLSHVALLISLSSPEHFDIMS